jgi:hypothetical protein
MRRCVLVARRTRLRAKGALGWGIAGFLAFQLALFVIVEKWHPHLADPEFASRVALLRARQAEAPGRPLVIMVGSSRCMEGFRPEVLPPLRTATGQSPLVFNCSHTASGPLLNLMMVTRLVRHGICPDWLFVEIMPPILSNEWLYRTALEAEDLPVLAQHIPPGKLCVNYLRSRLATYHSCQLRLLQYYAPDLVGAPLVGPYSLDRLGGRPAQTKPLTPADLRKRLDLARSQYVETLQHYQITPRADGATRALLELCRQRHIHIALVLMPEGTTFHSWYPPEARRQLDQFLAEIHRDYQVPVIDARSWLSDDDMYDSHHASSAGAERFTQRFGREVLQTILERDLETPPPEPATETAWRNGSNARLAP